MGMQTTQFFIVTEFLVANMTEDCIGMVIVIFIRRIGTVYQGGSRIIINHIGLVS